MITKVVLYYYQTYIKLGRSPGGVYFWKISGGVPYFWVLLHFYVTISKFFQISFFLRGATEGGHQYPEGGLSP